MVFGVRVMFAEAPGLLKFDRVAALLLNTIWDEVRGWDIGRADFLLQVRGSSQRFLVEWVRILSCPAKQSSIF